MAFKRESRILLGVLGFFLFQASAGFGEEEWKESPFLSDRNNPKLSGGRSDPSGEKEILLQGILWDPGAPTAILNNRVMGVGDRLGRWEVQEIRKDRVILSDGSSTREISPL